jgi:hypothetical protein
MRIATALGAVALTLTATSLTACGSGGSSDAAGGSGGDYCSELKADKAYFDSLSGSSGSDASLLGDAFSRVHALAGDAPANVAADWKTLDGAITTIETALADAGIKPSDLAAMHSGKLPSGVDPAKLQALVPKLQALSDSGFSDAADRIAADAKKTCGVDLSAS